MSTPKRVYCKSKKRIVLRRDNHYEGLDDGLFFSFPCRCGEPLLNLIMLNRHIRLKKCAPLKIIQAEYKSAFNFFLQELESSRASSFNIDDVLDEILYQPNNNLPLSIF